MERQQRMGRPAEGQVPFGGGHNEPPDHAPVAAHPPPQTEQGAVWPSGGDEERFGGAGTVGDEIFSAGFAGGAISEEAIQPTAPGNRTDAGEIVDLAQLERQRAYARTWQSQRYQELKTAVQNGDEEAIQRWERMKEIKRESARNWRKKNPEKNRESCRRYYERKRSKKQASARLDTDSESQ